MDDLIENGSSEMLFRYKRSESHKARFASAMPRAAMSKSAKKGEKTSAEKKNEANEE